MTNKIETFVEETKGRVKEAVGKALDDENLEREGAAQKEKAKAEDSADSLRKVADEKEQEAAGYKGEQKARSQN